MNSALVANHRSTSGAVIGVDTDAHSAIPRRNVPNAYAQGALASGAAREIREWWGCIWGAFGGSGDDLTSLRVGRIRLIHDIYGKDMNLIGEIDVSDRLETERG